MGACIASRVVVVAIWLVCLESFLALVLFVCVHVSVVLSQEHREER